ncbi:hypothetical protein SAMN05443245_6245 [Paraburkholderia fungorum]|uniref:Uncharacterized protein n=1 Tax=Paraburkholderia fungorum TaxID=134537 RepID=A0A1H1JF51_9BURK|nr:hypothetical protein SAMN05443245_6245 [Paraburkholderia fungorum]
MTGPASGVQHLYANDVSIAQSTALTVKNWTKAC